MTWGLLFRIRQALKGSLWVVPVVGGALGLTLGLLSVRAQDAVGDLGWQYSSGTAMTVLTTIVASAVGLTGFVVTVSVLVVQMATGTFSARYMRLWYRDPVLKAVLAVLVGTFAFSFSLLRRIESDSVPDLGVTLAGVFMGLGMVLFLVFFDRFVHRMRPVKVAALVAAAGRETIRLAAERASAPGDLAGPADGLPSLVVSSRRAGSIQAMDVPGLVRWADASGCLVVLRHGPGDFVSTGGALLEVHGVVPRPRLAERRLRGMVALGVERTLEQDPGFALRILVDIAIRALSPAVNDPTTAIQVLDHLEDTLTRIGRTPDLEGRWEHRDAAGRLRLVIPARRWSEFLALGVTEIREYGARSVQVMRRLRSTLEELRGSVLPEHVPAVEAELARLDATVANGFGGSPDADIAARADRQGIGGPRELEPG